ncbi:MAG: hypothetical protein ACM30E_01085 [Nitrososphaerales archaeon]
MSASLLAFLPRLFFSTRTPAVQPGDEIVSVMPFLALARELAALFLPVRPAQGFRDDLERSLMAAAYQQNARAALVGYGEPGTLSVGREGFERRWVIGAAAAAVGSAVSIAGIVAYVWWHRSERAA